jgi:catechol 2,3-dioxygenase-like lactoylglutathione lyase family enzyme
MKLTSTGLAHLGLRVTNIARARQFYVDTLGFEPLLEAPGTLICNAYGTTLAFVGGTEQTSDGDRFDPYRVGLDHLALGVTSMSDLEKAKQDLDHAGVPNNGIQLDAFSKANYISFYDPDGIAWELYAMPN